MTDDALRRIDALIQVTLRIARSARSGRVALARLAAAIDPAWIPRPWGERIVKELEAASTAARERIDGGRIDRALRDAWGAPIEDELDELDPDPVAVTPGAQIHRGVLDGSPVAVKVLRPGLAASVRQDLALLEGLTGPLEAAFPATNARALIREIRDRVLEELDLEHEAQIQRRFHRALRGHPFLTVPAPVTRLAHENVLVSEWVDGVPLREARDRDVAAANLLLFAIGSARSGMVHADLQPEDVLVLDGGRLAILDFGATTTVDAGRVQLAAAAFEAFATRDAGALGVAIEQLGWLRSSHAATALDLWLDSLGELAGPEPATLDSDAVRAATERLLTRPEQLVDLILTGALPPEDLWPARGLAQLFGTIAQVGATAPWWELARAALRDGWDARPR